MAGIVMALLGAWLLMLIAPDACFVCVIRRVLVERPAILFNRVTPSHVLMGVVLLVVVGTAMWFEAGDLLSFMSLAAPEFVSWAVTFEIGTLVEAGIAVLTVLATRRTRMAGVLIDGGLWRRLAARRVGRERRSRGAGDRAANDDADTNADADTWRCAA